MKRTCSWIWRAALGQKLDSEPGSNSRRLLSRVSLMVVLVLVWEGFAPFGFTLDVLPAAITYFLAAYSVFYFGYVVVFVTFLSSSNFILNPGRLFGNAVTSIALNVLCFAYLYRELGVKGPTPMDNWDHVYFSAVTFSTLGYGDFSPKEPARLWAALQAIVGNLHLGAVIGAAFLAATSSGPRSDQG